MQLHQKLHDRGLDVITVNVEGQQQMAAAEAVLQQHNIGLPNFCLKFDGSDDALTVLEAVDRGLPAINLYDRQGTLRYTPTGLDEEEMDRQLEALLAEPE